MSLEERIESEFKSALKQQNKIKVSTLRMVKADINNLRLGQNKKTLSDEDIIKIIQRQIRQHQDSIEQFEKGKRSDLAEKEKKELEILAGFVPAELSDEELRIIINEAISELGASSKNQMGKVMKSVMAKAKGRAEGKRISQIVSSILT